MKIQENVAAIMRLVKDQRNLSLAEFSAELEISRSTLQEYLSGDGNPSVLMLDHLAEKLNVDPLVLVSGVFDPTQMEIVLLMFRTTRAVTALPEGKRRQFARLFIQLVSLWE